jgi:hypothetical protein
MSGQADVKSIDTLAFVKAALASYAHESGQALAEVEIEGRRAVEWITVDRAEFWKAEVRRSADLVNQAMKDLEHCRTFKKVGDNQPSCIEEKKALEKARARLAFAEQKQEAVRRWTPVVQQQFRETGVRMVHFREIIDVQIPKAMARMERMLKSLDAYKSMSGPAAHAAAGAEAAAASVARQEPTGSEPSTTAAVDGSSAGGTPATAAGQASESGT